MTPPHGTYARFIREANEGPVCAWCRIARNLYMTAYRRKGPLRVLERALTAVATAHPDEYEQALATMEARYGSAE